MKKVLLLLFCLNLIAGTAFSQAGYIGVYSAPNACGCDLNNSANLMFAYVVHMYTPGAMGCQFALEVHGTPLTYLGEESDFQTLGLAPQGVAVWYDACLASPINVMKVIYFGTSAACDYIRVAADPAAVPPGVYVVDCAIPEPNLLTIYAGWIAYINNDGTCYNCSPYDIPSWCSTPVEKTTWGKVKEIYR